MLSCTFFGHRDCPKTIEPRLRETVADLIEHHGVTMFYVGHQGKFDAMVRRVLREFQGEYPHIEYAVVLAYLPKKSEECEDSSDTMLPEGIESVPPKFAIDWRNRWMLKRAEYVVVYITHHWGGAAQYAQKAARAGKTIFSLTADTDSN